MPRGQDDLPNDANVSIQKGKESPYRILMEQSVERNRVSLANGSREHKKQRSRAKTTYIPQHIPLFRSQQVSVASSRSEGATRGSVKCEIRNTDFQSLKRLKTRQSPQRQPQQEKQITYFAPPFSPVGEYACHYATGTDLSIVKVEPIISNLSVHIKRKM